MQRKKNCLHCTTLLKIQEEEEKERRMIRVIVLSKLNRITEREREKGKA